MARATRLPEVHIHDQGVAFELLAPPEGLTQPANAFSGEVLSIEVTPDDRSVVIVRLADGSVLVKHSGTGVDIAGGRAAQDEFAKWLIAAKLGAWCLCELNPNGATKHLMIGWIPYRSPNAPVCP